jgi:conjugal transfer pilus assembly protein TraW
MNQLILGVVLGCAALPLFSKSLGVIGETFPVREMSLLSLIEARLKALTESGELASMESAWQARAAESANRPHPVGLPRAILSRVSHYDPTLTLKAPVLNEQGAVLYPAGFRVNGLEARPDYKPCWLFLNGDDKAQILWAKSFMQTCTNPKIILTGGAVRDAEIALDSVIYFDQEGRLSKRFQLQAVPASIARDRNRLLIKEVAIKENGDAI